MFKVVSWNVNSISMRLPRVLEFIAAENPDVLCFQEIKCLNEKFPQKEWESLGYHLSLSGQKTYNGVATLSKQKPLQELKTFKNAPDAAARFLQTRFKDLTILNLYVPNGQEVGSEKYAYKLAWLEALHEYIRSNFTPQDKLILVGDFNIAPQDIDVHDPDFWRGRILFSDDEKKALAKLTQWGLVDTFRHLHPKDQQFSWWDYRNLSFPKNRGLRIDFILATPPVAEHCHEVLILRNYRKGEKPSDHAPVEALFKFTLRS